MEETERLEGLENIKTVRQCWPFFHKYTIWKNSCYAYSEKVQYQFRHCVKCNRRQERII